ncbi:hypothetical protein FRB93_012437 [Tulasnella sp. JGI-2019a]|nr:hypothetical protein FRB93_012437 [Tulasnella sp. JGI-2019a]
MLNGSTAIEGSLKVVVGSQDAPTLVDEGGDDSDSASVQLEPDDVPEPEGNEQVELVMDSQGKLSVHSQIEDYTLRGSDLENTNFLSFFVDTYEIDVTKTERLMEKQMHAPDDVEDEDFEEEDRADPTISSRPKRGRKRNQRSRYLASHPRQQTRQRIVRTLGHNYLPSFVGPYFPWSDDPDRREFYISRILALLKPWRRLSDLMQPHLSWEDAFAAFLASAPKHHLDIISNIQYYYQCSDAASRNREGSRSSIDRSPDAVGHRQRQQAEGEDEEELGEDASGLVQVTEELITELEQHETPTRESLHGQVAVAVGRLAKIFEEEDNQLWTTASQKVGPAAGDDLQRLHQWRECMAAQVSERNDPKMQDGPVEKAADRDGAGITLETGKKPEISASVQPIRDNMSPSEVNTAEYGQSGLLTDQRRAFVIIEWHLNETLAERKVPQLLMQIHGEGGTGKSKVIKTVTTMFEQRGAGHMLTRTAYTGIAASIIDGKTLHTLLGIPTRGGMPSRESIHRVAALLSGMAYLVLDEMSMISRPFFAKSASIIDMTSNALGKETGSSLPFGGLNVIIVGDFHQFPPVASKQNAPLYWPCNPGKDTLEYIAGHQLYEQFKTVVILKEQVRVVDAV